MCPLPKRFLLLLWFWKGNSKHIIFLAFCTNLFPLKWMVVMLLVILILSTSRWNLIQMFNFYKREAYWPMTLGFFTTFLLWSLEWLFQFYLCLYIYCLTELSSCVFRSENRHGQHTFDLPTVANDMGVTPVELTNQLYDLKVWISG